MGIAINLTPHAVGELVARDVAGEPLYVVVVKATFSFATPGRLEAVSPQPIVDLDRYSGEPATSGLLAVGDIGLPKPRVDVLLQGALRFPAPLAEAIVSLEIGSRLQKRLKVFGDRAWVPAVASELSATRPRPMSELPIAWELASGGADGTNPNLIDRRNPAGRMTGSKNARDLQGKLLPNFEPADDRGSSWKTRREPVGFGPIAPHWEPRAPLAGTYDQRWQEQRAPLLPEDFKPAFLNCAPVDQQLPRYIPGEEVRLRGMTRGGQARFALPELSLPVTFVMRTLIEETRIRVDTIIIEPAEERVSLVARAFCSPRPSANAVREIFVGPLTRGRRLALELGKPFLDLRALPVRTVP